MKERELRHALVAEKDILRRKAALRALHGRSQRQTGSQQIDRIGSPANVLTSETIGARPDRPAYWSVYVSAARRCDVRFHRSSKRLKHNHTHEFLKRSMCVYMKRTPTSIDTYQSAASRILTWSLHPLRSIILIQNMKVMEFRNAGDFNKSTAVIYAKVIPLWPSLWGCPGHNLHRSTCGSQQALGPLRSSHPGTVQIDELSSSWLN